MAAESGDNYIYQDSYATESVEKPFIAHEVVQIYDSNNGVYNNQIQFSTQALTNGGKWVDFQNSYIEIPFTLALSTPVTTAATANPFMMGLKDGSIQLVDSIVLQYNGTSMAQPSIFTNVMQHFRIVSSWTQDDLIKWGDATMIAPDVPVFRFSPGIASSYGDGISNNIITPSITTTASAASWLATGSGFNTGFLKRMQLGSYNPAAVANSLQPAPLTAGQAGFVGRNFWTTATAAGITTCYWQMLLTLRLKDLHDFFDKLPLLKPAKIDLTINLNTAGGTVTYTSAADGTTSPTMATSGYNQTAGHSCPFMLASAADLVTPPAATVAPQPNSRLIANAQPPFQMSVACGINGVRGNPLFTGASPIIQNCRWYVPVYEMNPEYEARLIESNPMKTIYYDDFYTFTSLNNINGTISALLTAGVVNPKYVLLFPFYNSAVANSGNSISNSPYQSFFDSAPATTSPITLTNVQVQVGGRSMFPLIEQYNFQQFMDEFSSIFAVDGGKSSMCTSGLLNKSHWERSPVYVCDLSRRLPADDGSSKAVQISASVGCQKADGTVGANIDVIAFVLYGRSATFNLLNGLLESAE